MIAIALLMLALASADQAGLHLHANGQPQPSSSFSPSVQGGNALLREAIHAKHCVRRIAVPALQLRAGCQYPHPDPNPGPGAPTTMSCTITFRWKAECVFRFVRGLVSWPARRLGDDVHERAEVETEFACCLVEDRQGGIDAALDSEVGMLGGDSPVGCWPDRQPRVMRADGNLSGGPFFLPRHHKTGRLKCSVCGGSGPVFLVGFDDATDDRVPDDVLRGEPQDRNAFDAAQGVLRLAETGADPGLEIDLRTVAGDDHA